MIAKAATTPASQGAQPSFADFLELTNGYSAKLEAFATRARTSEPGTAALLDAFAVEHAGRVLDLIARWPS
jgi:hypothetical protein